MIFDDLPFDAVRCASSAASEVRDMGSLHIGVNVLLALLNEGYVVLATGQENISSIS